VLPPGGANQVEPQTRGVVFRCAARLLGERIPKNFLQARNQVQIALRDALSLRTSPMSWLAGELFTQLMELIAQLGGDPRVFARDLAIAVVNESFDRFYASSAESLSAKSSLSAAEILWRRYHTWGRLVVKEAEAQSARILFEGPNQPGVHAFIEGWLQSIAARSGGKDPVVKCEIKGEIAAFEIRWS
jgi:hypothetical protein